MCWVWFFKHPLFNRRIALHRTLLLEDPQDLDETAPHDDKHEKKYEAFTYGWIIDVFSRFTDRDMSSFVNIFVEFGTSIAEAAWRWLEGWGVIIAVDKIIVGNHMLTT